MNANGHQDKEKRPNRRLTRIDFRGLPPLGLLRLACVHPCLSRRSLRRRIHSRLSLRPGICELAGTSNPLRGCDSDLAQYSHTPIHPPATLRVAMRAGYHSAWPDSRTRRRRGQPVRRSPSSVVSTAQVGLASEARSTTRTWAKSEVRSAS
jgi:hypothetical protein